SIQRLKNQQHRVMVVGIKNTLHLAQFLCVFLEDDLIVAFGFEEALNRCGKLLKVNLLSSGNAEIVIIDLHPINLPGSFCDFISSVDESCSLRFLGSLFTNLPVEERITAPAIRTLPRSFSRVRIPFVKH